MIPVSAGSLPVVVNVTATELDVSNAELKRGRTKQRNMDKGKSLQSGKPACKGSSRRRSTAPAREDASDARGHRSPARDRVADSDGSGAEKTGKK